MSVSRLNFLSLAERPKEFGATGSWGNVHGPDQVSQ
jgi:hypothetical protein